MITVEQCRAARGLLGWTQGDLAQACGLSKTAINNFEKGNSDIKQVSLDAVQRAFEKERIEFLEGNGLKKRSEAFSILRGPAAFDSLLDDIISSLKSLPEPAGAEVLAMTIDDRFLRRVSPEKVLEYLQALEKLGATQRVLCVPGYDSLLGSVQSCRWISPETLHLTHMAFVYGDKVAWPFWGEAMILVIQGAEMSAAERKRFDFMWDIAEDESAASMTLQGQGRRKA
jgi:transcriptional regulator with XRE-family HTH domain